MNNHPLATKSGLAMFLGVLIYQGGMCPQCGTGTRAINKKFARCKNCGKKVERRKLPRK